MELLVKGLIMEHRTKLWYLPKSISSNDFIFSVLAEERGFVGSLIVVISYVFLIWSGLRTSLRSHDRFGTIFVYWNEHVITVACMC